MVLHAQAAQQWHTRQEAAGAISNNRRPMEPDIEPQIAREIFTCSKDSPRERSASSLCFITRQSSTPLQASQLRCFLSSARRLAETIDRFEVSLVLHGHAHNGAYRGSTRMGIPVYNCALSVVKSEGRPSALREI
jgi:hypothetical protein